MLPCPRRNESPVPFGSPSEDHWRPDHTCSYCGSLSPEEFLRRVEAGEKIGATDKNYKAYIGNNKFYFQHFTPEQCEKFVALYNEGKLNFEGSRGFYVLPFFCRRG